MATAAAKSREWVSEISMRLPAAASAAGPESATVGGSPATHLDLAQAEAAAEAKRLDHRLLGGEAGGQVAGRARRARAGVVALGLR